MLLVTQMVNVRIAVLSLIHWQNDHILGYCSLIKSNDHVTTNLPRRDALMVRSLSKSH